MPSIYLESLGCVKNLVDAEVLLGETLGEVYTLELNPEDADIIIVNTCGFIEDARRESRDIIAGYVELKRRIGRDIKIVAMGCLAERSPAELLADFPDLDAVWGLEVPASLDGPIQSIGTVASKAGWIGKPSAPREGTRLLTTLPAYAYLKISDGCDNGCAYCAIPLIRGGLQSRPLDSILKEAGDLENCGVKELILIGQDITAYGHDRRGGPGLASLLERLLADFSFPRLRLLYAHPAHLDDAVIDLLAKEPRLCRYLDLPLQHAADPVLRAMGRGYDNARILSLLQRFAEAGLTVRTTLLAGFPGETEADFLKMLELVKAGWFHHLGAFAYSPEKGTRAHDFPGAVPPEEAVRRRDALMQAQAAVAFKWLNSRIGKTETVLVDGVDGRGQAVTRSRREAPDSDGVIFLPGRGLQPGDMVKACIEKRVGYDLMAQVEDGGGQGQRHGRRTGRRHEHGKQRRARGQG